MEKSWKDQYADKVVSRKQALSSIRNGQTIFIGSGAGEPTLLTETLVEMAPRFWNVEIIHLKATSQSFLPAQAGLEDHFRCNMFYLGRGVSATLKNRNVDYTPMNVNELPRAMRNGNILIDVALVQVAPPDSFGHCSLGISVDATKAAVENAHLVIAQVNEKMPSTMGDSMIPLEDIDFLVEGNAPLIEFPSPRVEPVDLTIGRHIANLIKDGMTLHFDRGPISSATMRYLDSKRNLGIHTDFITDDILRLIKTKAVNNRQKKIYKGKTVATMVVGTYELYDEVDGNPYIELYPIDEVNDPNVISMNDNVVSVLPVQEMELSGRAAAYIEDISQVGSLPSGMCFIDGARRSHGGFSILALPSTTPDGNNSRIVVNSSSKGAFFSRSQVDYVVTEYGVANLFGLSFKERAIALISIAHPRFRARLLSEAKAVNYVDETITIPPAKGCIYPYQYEFTQTFGKGNDNVEIFFRPVKPTDARRIQRLFYSLSPADARMRYHGTIKALSNQEAQNQASVDFSQDMAIVGLVGPINNPMIVAEGRYMYNPSNNMGEFDILIHGDYQRHGIGKFLGNYLKKIAYSRGLSGIYAEVVGQNEGIIALLNKAWPTAVRHFDSGACTFTLRFPSAEVENPKDSVFLYSGRFADFSYGEGHPFNPARARTVLQLIRDQGYLDEPWMRIQEPELINRDRLIESHDPDFIAALEEANSGKWNMDFLQFHLGGDECPIFPGLFDYILLYASSTISGVRLIMDENTNVVFNPLGGFHHSSRSMAEGFCYVNDVIVAIDMFLSRGYRVAYVDIDAHHGNGVQDAYYGDDRVLCISIHESGKTLYPWSGFETETGEDIGKGYNINIPLPEETDDEAFEKVLEEIVNPAVKRFAPSVVVAVIGADAHRSDPLSHLCLTNNGMVKAIEEVRQYSNHLLLLGAGGYDEQTTTQAWCRMWAAANRINALPDFLLVVGGSFMGSEGMGGGEIVDMAYRTSGDKKNAIIKEMDRLIAFHKENTIPYIGRRLSDISALRSSEIPPPPRAGVQDTSKD